MLYASGLPKWVGAEKHKNGEKKSKFDKAVDKLIIAAFGPLDLL